jgi:hypothetical protein
VTTRSRSSAPTPPPDDPERPSASSVPPPWIRTLTHLVALAWGSCELALWGARPGALGFIGVIITGANGAWAAAKARELAAGR